MNYLTPSTGEFPINSFTIDDQDDPRIAPLPNGGFLVVWESDGPTGVGNSIYQQRYNAKGLPVGDNVLVNTTTSISQSNPRVEVLKDGAWVVSWNSYINDSEMEVQGRLYSKTGVALGKQFQVNTTEDGPQDGMEIASLDDGGFLIVWHSDDAGGVGWTVKAQRYDASGTAVDDEYTVSKNDQGEQRYPATTTLSDGRVAVSWQAVQYDTNGNRISTQSYVRMLDAQGVPQGDAIEVLSDQATVGVWSIAALTTGGFVVTGWSKSSGVTSVVTQQFDADGNAQGDSHKETVVGANSYEPRVAGTPDGGYVMIMTVDVPGSGGIFGHEDTFMVRFDAKGNKLGEAQMVNETVGQRSYQDDADVTVLSDGRIVVTWEGQSQDGDGDGVFARIFDAQFVGSDSRDVLTGTSGSDVMFGRGGADRIVGLGGADMIDAGGGKDNVKGGNGNDNLIGWNGNDKLFGGKGGDKLDGGTGRDKLVGGAGNDRIDGGKGNDVLTGNGGRDDFVFLKGSGKDRVTDFHDDRDTVLLDDGLWKGALSKAKVIEKYASVQGDDIVFDFGKHELTLEGFTNLAGLKDDLEFI